MAVKIRLKRLGKVRVPQYRIVVVDSRKKRDGKVIEEIGKYHPKEDPSYISVVSDRAQYWLGVGAQPSDAVAKLLKITGDWQTFKGYQGTEGTLKIAEPKPTSSTPSTRPSPTRTATASGEAVTKKAAAKKAAGQEGRRRGREPRRGRRRRRGPGAEAPAAEAPVADEAPSSSRRSPRSRRRDPRGCRRCGRGRRGCRDAGRRAGGREA